MNAIVNVLSGPAWQHLALALLHTLWQGLAAAALLWLLLRRIPAQRPEARYWTAFSILAGLLLCGIATWSLLDLQWPKGPVCGAAVPAAKAGETPAPQKIAGETPALRAKAGGTPAPQGGTSALQADADDA